MDIPFWKKSNNHKKKHPLKLRSCVSLYGMTLGKKSKKKCITKDDIGQPSHFVHVSHVGFDKNAGFRMDNVDDTMKQFFDKVIWRFFLKSCFRKRFPNRFYHL